MHSVMDETDMPGGFDEYSYYNKFYSSNERDSLLDTICDPSRKNDIAVTDYASSKSFTYGDLVKDSIALAQQIKVPENAASIATFQLPGYDYVRSMLATWMLKKVFVPLQTRHSPRELQYIMLDSKASAVLYSKSDDNEENIQNHHRYDCLNSFGVPLIDTDNIDNSSFLSCKPLAGCWEEGAHISNDPDDGALVLYTSGTTGLPKGVLHTQSSLEHQVKSLVSAWDYSDQDKALHFLPLHHLHGVLNNLLCVLYAGGEVEFIPSAQPHVIYERIAREKKLYSTHDLLKHNLFTHKPANTSMLQQVDEKEGELKKREKKEKKEKGDSKAMRPITIFMAVPTIYSKLLDHAAKPTYPGKTHLTVNMAEMTKLRGDIRDSTLVFPQLRLMASGSAAMPTPVMSRWQRLSQQTLLERYGMTECGMILSNPLEPVEERMPGYVGKPLPFVQCRVVDEDEDGNEVEIPANSDQPGELRVRGPTVFSHYLNKPQETKEAFDWQGWFKTGDIVQQSEEGVYRILGRASSDIIKTKGYKISALEIERELLSFTAIREACVVGEEDETLGQALVAVCVLKTTYREGDNHIAGLDEFLQDRLAHYKRDFKRVHIVEELPRNAMGKINKKTLLLDLGILDDQMMGAEMSRDR